MGGTKMRMRYCMLVLLCSCSMLAFGQPKELLHQPYSVKSFYLDSLLHYSGNRNRAELSVELAQLGHWAQQQGDDELAGQFELTAIAELPWETMLSNESRMRIISVNVKADEQHLYYLQAQALQVLGRYWADNKKFGLAFENYLAAYNIYSKFKPEQFPPKQLYLYELGGAYYHFDDTDNTIRYMKEALNTESHARADLTNTITNTIGLDYRKMGKYDSAETYFRRVLEKATKANDSAWIGIASGNIGITYFHQKKYAEAIPLLEKDIELCLATANIRNAGRSLTVLAQIYYALKDYDKSEQTLNKALAMLEDKPFWPEYRLAEPIYTLLSRINAVKNNMQRAYLYADSALIAKDSIQVEDDALSFAKAREKADYMEHKLEQEQLLNQKKIQVLIRNGLMIAILMLTIIAFLFINRQRLKQKKLEVEKKNAENELNLASQQLDSFRQGMQEKNSMIEQFTGELEKLRSGAAEQETSADILTQLQHAIILTDEQWESFRLTFEKVHKNFFVNLRAKFPGLSQAEIRFLALTKLNLSSKEMASMLGISPNTIRIYRHRLRRKLELDKEDMIEELVSNL